MQNKKHQEEIVGIIESLNSLIKDLDNIKIPEGFNQTFSNIMSFLDESVSIANSVLNKEKNDFTAEMSVDELTDYLMPEINPMRYHKNERSYF